MLSTLRAGPQPAEWEDHRDTISSLYRQNTLKAVMERMEKDHGFVATKRMYKARITAWGLRKNFRYENVKEAFEHMANCDAKSCTGQQHIDLSCIYSYIRRLPEEKYQLLMGYYYHFKTRSPMEDSGDAVTPPPRLVSAATDLHRAEECVFNLRSYVLGLFDRNLWSGKYAPKPHVTDLLIEWYHASVTAQGALRCGRTSQAFRVIQPYFDEYKSALMTHDPRLFVSTFALSAILSAVRPDLGRIALRFAASISETVYGPSNPYYAVMQLLSGMDFEEQISVMSTAFEGYYQIIQDQLRPGDSFEAYAHQGRQAARIFVSRSDVSLREASKNDQQVTRALDRIADMQEHQRTGDAVKARPAEAPGRPTKGSRSRAHNVKRRGVSAKGETQVELRYQKRNHDAGSRRSALSELSVKADLLLSLGLSPDLEQRRKVQHEFERLLDNYCGLAKQ